MVPRGAGEVVDARKAPFWAPVFRGGLATRRSPAAVVADHAELTAMVAMLSEDQAV